MKLFKIYLLLFLLCPGFIYATDISVMIGGGGFVQGDDFLTYTELSDSSRQLTVQVANRIIKHISIGADITLVDAYSKYTINDAHLISDVSYVDYMTLYFVSNYDFLDNVIFIQVGLGMLVELMNKERILLGGMIGLGINIPVSDNFFIPVMARTDLFMVDGEFRYPISFGIGITYRIEDE